MANANHNFYGNMHINRKSLSGLLLKESAFLNVPEDWHVIITDIKGSTAAVLGGSSETVNYIATGSIVTLLNLAFKAKIAIPFFFGGDGATFIVPSILVELAMKKLMTYQDNVLQNFGLDLRVGSVPVQTIYGQGHEIKLSKFGLTEFFSIPVVLGDGLSYAEQIIKGETYKLEQEIDLSEELDLEGMQCRWDKIGSPGELSEILTLLVISPNVETQATVFSKVLKSIDEIYGIVEKRQPITIEKLKLNSTFNRVKTEMQNRIGKIKIFELLQTWLATSIGKLYFLTSYGKRYLKRLVEMSDTLVMDGKINTVISGDDAQRVKLFKVLDELENLGEVVYGFHISNASIMSCYVRDMKNDHIHFVDGAEGGYTKAAAILKGKIKDVKWKR
ncbi:DUF3095 domain-containing protein [Pedobacter frigiditerrae]|uniref:DUF3095 domain-containing protein n=1 Tax=Pedobacter frigiditerrae TaxID=2530452 RepID=A0A4R0MKE4_9SPHI|nr:DUF3095 family protein [Pedobacter frigiditerrae]TCC86923.1 DUF3095 domain-containing protein [Pedobacter frigiditerrae]